MVKTSRSNAEGAGWIPGWGTNSPTCIAAKKKKKSNIPINSIKIFFRFFKKTELTIIAVTCREHWGMSVLRISGGCFGRCYVFYLHVASLSLEEEAVPC